MEIISARLLKVQKWLKSFISPEILNFQKVCGANTNEIHETEIHLYFKASNTIG